MSKPEQCLFLFQGADHRPDGIPLLLFVIPEAGWDYMQNGLGHDFDLTNLGIPMKVIIGRCETRASGLAKLREAGLLSDKTTDATRIDVAFGAKPKQ